MFAAALQGSLQEKTPGQVVYQTRQSLGKEVSLNSVLSDKYVITFDPSLEPKSVFNALKQKGMSDAEGFKVLSENQIEITRKHSQPRSPNLASMRMLPAFTGPTVASSQPTWKRDGTCVSMRQAATISIEPNDSDSIYTFGLCGCEATGVLTTDEKGKAAVSLAHYPPTNRAEHLSWVKTVPAKHSRILEGNLKHHVFHVMPGEYKQNSEGKLELQIKNKSFMDEIRAASSLQESAEYHECGYSEMDNGSSDFGHFSITKRQDNFTYNLFGLPKNICKRSPTQWMIYRQFGMFFGPVQNRVPPKSY